MPKVLTRLRIDEVSAVDRGAGDGVKIMLMKRDEEPYWKREFNQEERDRDAKSGAALPDGSFPIHNAGDLKNAMRAIGRSKNPGKAKAHIRARARALGLTDQLSDAFKRDTMSKFSEFFLGKKQDNSEVVEKAVAALAESLGTIMKGDDTVEKKGEDFAASLQEFQDHLVKNLTGAPALDSKEKDMLKSLAKALGLTVADNASDEDVQKQIAAHYAKQQRELDLAKAGFTAEELAHYKAFGENDDEDEDDKKKDEKKKFREMSHEERAKLMKKADDGEPEHTRKLREDHATLQAEVVKIREKDEKATIEKRLVDIGAPTSLVDKVHKLMKVDKDSAEAMIEQLKIANAALKKSGAFKELGATGGNGGSDKAIDELNAKAAEYRKAHPEASEAQAFAKVYQDPANKELAQRERRESAAPIFLPPGA